MLNIVQRQLITTVLCRGRRGVVSRKATRQFHVLGIETSCDDSALAIVNADTDEVVYQSVASQWHEHAEYGGIVPILAARAHDRNIPLLVQDMKEKGLAELVDVVAVTRGPGIKPCLRVGVTTAVELAKELRKPLVMVNHLQGHALIARLQGACAPTAPAPQGMRGKSPLQAAVRKVRQLASWFLESTPTPTYPFLSLVISGGHTLLAHVENYDTFHLVGSTLDDSIGEAFDKVARLLRLSDRGEATEANVKLHGGVLVERAAALSCSKVVNVRVEGWF